MNMNILKGMALIGIFLLFSSAAHAEVVSRSLLAQFVGEADGDLVGKGVSGVGDVNGDGYDDFVVGAPEDDTVAESAGAAYLVYGQFDEYTDQSLGDPGVVKFTGEIIGDEAGFRVGGVGDLNNDGYDDFVVTTDGDDDLTPGTSNLGTVYVIYGQAQLFTSMSLGDSSIVPIVFDAAGTDTEFTVSHGNFNGDDYEDILIGATYDSDVNSPELVSGAAYVIYGQSAQLSSTPTMVKFRGLASYDNTGRSVAAGDINGDGYDDVVIGAFSNNDAGDGAGAVYVVYGESATMATRTLDDASVVQITGEEADDEMGLGLAVGDLNGDGFGDIITAATGGDAGGAYFGDVYVVYGQSTALVSSSIVSLAAATFAGEAEYDNPQRVDAGDIDNDGYDDLIIGSSAHDDGAGYYSGVAWIVYGQSALYSGITSLGDTAVDKIVGENEDDQLGVSVSVSGDINGDGMNDVIVGANQNDVAGDLAGAVYLGYLYTDLDGDGEPNTFLFTGSDTTDDRAITSDTVSTSEDGGVTIEYFRSSVSFTPFAGVVPKMLIPTDAQSLIVSDGKKIQTYDRDATQLDGKRLYKKAGLEPKRYRLKLADLDDDGIDEVIFLGQRKKKGKIILYRLKEDSQLSNKVQKVVSIKKKIKRVRLKIKNDRVIVELRRKKFKFKYTINDKLKRL